MPLPLNIYVDGKRRERLVLEAAEVPEADYVILDYEAAADGPALRSNGSHYADGAYHFWRSVIDTASPGLYRANCVTIMYTDGSHASVPISGDIVIEIEAIALPATPPSAFTAR